MDGEHDTHPNNYQDLERFFLVEGNFTYSRTFEIPSAISLKFHCNFNLTPDAAAATSRRIFAKSGRIWHFFARILLIPMKTIV